MLLKNSAWPMPPIAVQNPDSGDIEAWFDESFDEVQTMLAILLEKAGLPEGDLNNEAETVKILKVQAEVFAVHFHKEVVIGGGSWFCTCLACDIFRVLKMWQILGTMRGTRKQFEEEIKSEAAIGAMRRSEIMTAHHRLMCSLSNQLLAVAAPVRRIAK
jgi:hypothetical protein